jgi:hypothetical protein
MKRGLLMFWRQTNHKHQNLSLIWHSRFRVAEAPSEAPSERAMKRLAEERLMVIQLAEISRLGTYYLLSLIL